MTGPSYTQIDPGHFQNKVTLVAHGSEHLDATFRWLTRDDVLRRQIDSLAAPASLSANASYWEAKWSDVTREDFAIIIGGGHVGNCGLSSIDHNRKKCEIWIYVAERVQKMAGRSAMMLLLARAFHDLLLEKVYLRVLVTNEKAAAFYRRMGFKDEGIARHDTIHDGKPIDSHTMSMLQKEFVNA